MVPDAHQGTGIAPGQRTSLSEASRRHPICVASDVGVSSSSEGSSVEIHLLAIQARILLWCGLGVLTVGLWLGLPPATAAWRGAVAAAVAMWLCGRLLRAAARPIEEQAAAAEAERRLAEEKAQLEKEQAQFEEKVAQVKKRAQAEEGRRSAKAMQ